MTAQPQTIHLLQLGVGQVGGALRRQLLAERDHVATRYGIKLAYCGLFTASKGLFNADGLSNAEVAAFPDGATADASTAIDQIPEPFILIDTTSSDTTVPLLEQALVRGGSVVTANKRPLAGAQSAYDDLMAAAAGRLYFETTVGAGLPVIATLQSLVATGDEIEHIEGCFSGTLGYIFSQLQAGHSYSQAVADAMSQGFTEADPREDLSGMDVARKVMILARLAGQKLEPSSVKLTGLYPESLASLTVPEFMRELPSLDAEFAQKTAAAKAAGQVLRYVATVTPETCTVSLQEVPAGSDIGTLTGPDNIVVVGTRRYHDHQLVIKGPGAGPEVTAAGVFGDILRAAKAL